jgi:hypothetical protein
MMPSSAASSSYRRFRWKTQNLFVCYRFFSLSHSAAAAAATHDSAAARNNRRVPRPLAASGGRVRKRLEIVMQHETVGSGQARHIDDIVEDDDSGVRLVIKSVVYWGVLATGFVVPIAGAIWGIAH